MTKQILTQAELKEQLHYNPETGLFTRLVANSNSVNIGDIANNLDRYGYIQISINNKNYKAHRLAFLYIEGELPPEQVDHINHIRNDNRWINLRKVTNQENQKNRTISKNNTSGVVGVVWYKRDKIWKAQIKINGKNKHLGYYAYKSEAAKARKAAEKKYGFHINHGANYS